MVDGAVKGMVDWDLIDEPDAWIDPDTGEPIYQLPPDDVDHGEAGVMASLPWTWPPEKMREIWESGITGRGCIGINLDTGWTRHNDLPEPIGGRNFTTSNPDDITDRHGHGNHTIGSHSGRNGIGGAPGSDLKVGKVLGDRGSGSNTNAGLKWAASVEGDVVSCSWGGGSSVHPSTEAALKEIEESGKWIVFAAGNSRYSGRGSTVISPALSSHNLACASIDSSGNPSGFSSGGRTVDIAAGGSGIVSAGIRGSNRVVMYGTSMATPTAAGALLLLRQSMKQLGMNVYLNSRGLVEFLTSNRFLDDTGPPGRDPRYGDGIVNVFAILEWISKHRPKGGV